MADFRLRQKLFPLITMTFDFPLWDGLLTIVIIILHHICTTPIMRFSESHMRSTEGDYVEGCCVICVHIYFLFLILIGSVIDVKSEKSSTQEGALCD